MIEKPEKQERRKNGVVCMAVGGVWEVSTTDRSHLQRQGWNLLYDIRKWKHWRSLSEMGRIKKLTIKYNFSIDFTVRG